MRLITAHKVLISAALVLSLLLTARAGFQFAANHDKSAVVSVGGGLALSAALALYLRSLWRK
ncbi:MAG TPA: hypothetical protein VJT12_02790 [Methyloceanibacter sp.]|nr:hypothetical protein [Methyloceanibacter sp.]